MVINYRLSDTVCHFNVQRLEHRYTGRNHNKQEDGEQKKKDGVGDAEEKIGDANEEVSYAEKEVGDTNEEVIETNKEDEDSGRETTITEVVGVGQQDIASRILRGRLRKGAGHVPGGTWPHQGARNDERAAVDVGEAPEHRYGRLAPRESDRRRTAGCEQQAACQDTEAGRYLTERAAADAIERSGTRGRPGHGWCWGPAISGRNREAGLG
ncbi:hypothetical protein NDU88_001458 [Pleurodeles waltl]|uniref:Uncharacterized protein n=1 Tax=Pleurodeles waltl TaxID=8319 RepID=A0AAV7LCV0_PLEWA|nr:hypothetical protein NDU88_001458 [Pleurodeles waltl]